MAFQPVVNTAEINVIYTMGGETMQNVFYAKFGGAYAQLNLDALAAAVDVAVAANFLPLQAIEAFYARTEVRGLTVQNDFIAINAVSAGSGAIIAAAVPNNVTFSVKKNSALTGRSARGRSYWIGLDKSKLDPVNENFIITAHVAAIVAAIGAIRTAIDAVFLWDAVLVSRFTGGLPRAAGVTFTWISESAVDERVDTQRGRLPG